MYREQIEFLKKELEDARTEIAYYKDKLHTLVGIHRQEIPVELQQKQSLGKPISLSKRRNQLEADARIKAVELARKRIDELDRTENA